MSLLLKLKENFSDKQIPADYIINQTTKLLFLQKNVAQIVLEQGKRNQEMFQRFWSVSVSSGMYSAISHRSQFRIVQSLLRVKVSIFLLWRRRSSKERWIP